MQRTFLFHVILLLNFTIVSGQPLKVNRVSKTQVRQEGVLTEEQLTTLPAVYRIDNHAYLDGHGRPVQEVSKISSPLGHDIAVHHSYDAQGREVKKYLPYVRFSTDGKYQYLAPSATAPADLLNFYQQVNDGVANTTLPYSEAVYENSPLNRVLEESAPGEAWALGTGHTTKVRYSGNSTGDAVLRWEKTTTGFTATNIYAPGTLMLTEATDANGHRGREFKDNNGQIVASEIQGDNGTFLRTYNVYNTLHQLVGIIPPNASQIAGSALPAQVSTAMAVRECYQYSYDQRGRQVTKQLPGAAVVYMVYDMWDRIVLTQDGNQRAAQKWSYIKYDAQNRPVMTGEITLSGNQAAATAAVNQFYVGVGSNPSLRYEQAGEAQHNYTNRSFPQLNAQSTVNTVTYYDNYFFLEVPVSLYAFQPDTTLGASGYFTRTNGLVTGTKVRILDTDQYLGTVTYYNKRYQPIQVVSDNQWGQVDVQTNQYDFLGKVLHSKQVHNGLEPLTQLIDFEYDDRDRLVRVYHRLNDEARVELSAQQYNELGQLRNKLLHTQDGESLQNLDYSYNIRGWQTGLNTETLSTSPSRHADLFTYALGYEAPVGGLAVTPQYNGNISAYVQSRPLEQGGAHTSGYTYSYDTRSQLLTASYQRTGNALGNGLYNESMGYDANGNILSLERTGSSPTGTVQTIDNLVYSYMGNQLQSVVDSGDPQVGFKDRGSITSDYSYDANGNLTRDGNKEISSIRYNHLNLVSSVVFNDNRKVVYTYTASGKKLQQTVYGANGSIVLKRQYGEGVIYKNDSLQEVQHSEGRIVHKIPGNVNSGWEYQYHLKDHLGNVRLSFTSVEESQSTTATLETAKATSEQKDFLNYDQAVKVSSLLFDHTKDASAVTHYAVRLNGSEGERYGLAKSLSVMPGDKITASVYGKYVDKDKTNWSSALTNLMTSIVMGTAPGATVIDGGVAGSPAAGAGFPFTGLLDKSNDTGTGPKAYLNYLVFDRNYILQDGGYVKLSENAKEYGQNTLHEKLEKELTITQPGYVYVYLSNEGTTPTDVYFDDFNVTQVLSPVVETTDYYAFGMTAETQSREGLVAQQYKYNGKEQQPETDWYDYGARMYDAQLGRWHAIDPLAEKYASVSPYNYVLNNPVKYVDPDGREIVPANFYDFLRLHDILGAVNSSKTGRNLLKDSEILSKGTTTIVTFTDGPVLCQKHGTPSDGEKYKLAKYQSSLSYGDAIYMLDMESKIIRIIQEGSNYFIQTDADGSLNLLNGINVTKQIESKTPIVIMIISDSNDTNEVAYTFTRLLERKMFKHVPPPRVEGYNFGDNRDAIHVGESRSLVDALKDERTILRGSDARKFMEELIEEEKRRIKKEEAKKKGK